MKRQMTGVGEVEVLPLDSEFSSIEVNGFVLKVPTVAVDEVLSGGPVKLSQHAVRPLASLQNVGNPGNPG